MNGLMLRAVSLLATLCLSTGAWAFDLDRLSARLAAPEVVRGPFIQEKYLRALPHPLSARAASSWPRGMACSGC